MAKPQRIDAYYGNGVLTLEVSFWEECVGIIRINKDSGEVRLSEVKHGGEEMDYGTRGTLFEAIEEVLEWS